MGKGSVLISDDKDEPTTSDENKHNQIPEEKSALIADEKDEQKADNEKEEQNVETDEIEDELETDEKDKLKTESEDELNAGEKDKPNTDDKDVTEIDNKKDELEIDNKKHGMEIDNKKDDMEIEITEEENHTPKKSDKNDGTQPSQGTEEEVSDEEKVEQQVKTDDDIIEQISADKTESEIKIEIIAAEEENNIVEQEKIDKDEMLTKETNEESKQQNITTSPTINTEKENRSEQQQTSSTDEKDDVTSLNQGKVLLSPEKFKFTTHQIRFKKRFELFYQGKQPPPLTYDDYEKGSDFSCVSQNGLLASSADSFRAGKAAVDKVLSQLDDDNSDNCITGCNDENSKDFNSIDIDYCSIGKNEAISFAKVCVGNLVFLHKLSQVVDSRRLKEVGNKGKEAQISSNTSCNISFDFKASKQYCTIKIT